MQRTLATAGSFLALLIAFSASAHATPLNIDFGSHDPAPSAAFGAAAGQVGVWNDIAFTGTTSGLLGLNGAATGVSLTIGGATMDGFQGTLTTDPFLLMQDNLLAFANPWTVTLTGLSNGLYDVYLYEPENTLVGSGSGSVNGQLFSNINGGFSGAFVQNSNYLLLTNVLVSGGTMAMTGFNAGPNFSGLAGVQIVDAGAAAVPEPASMLLLGSGLAGLYARRRRRV